MTPSGMVRLMRPAVWLLALLVAAAAPPASALTLDPNPGSLAELHDNPLSGCYKTFTTSDDGRLLRNPQTGGQEVFVGVTTPGPLSRTGGDYTGVGVGAYPCEILGGFLPDPDGDGRVDAEDLGVSNEGLDMS